MTTDQSESPDQDLDEAFIKAFLTPADYAAYKADPTGGRTQALNDAFPFGAIARKAKGQVPQREPGTYLTAINDTAVTLEAPGVNMTLVLNHKEDVQRFADDYLSPETAAWKSIAGLARKGMSDPIISQSPKALSFLRMIEALADANLGEWPPEKTLQPIADFVKSQQAANNAKVKNQHAREWVLTAWENRSDRTQPKKTFAAEYAELIKQTFKNSRGLPLVVTPSTIERDWLPKNNV